MQAKGSLQKWNIDCSNMEQLWKDCDSDGKGKILFDEFSNWAIRKNLDLDDDDDDDDNTDEEKKEQKKINKIKERKI